jgi:hypothetical protein
MTDRDTCPLCGEPITRLNPHLENEHDATDLCL